MSPSLPTVGGDVDLWGGELNTFLQVGHNPDGTLNSTALVPPVTVVPTSAAVNVTQFGVVPTSPTGTDVTAALNTLLVNQIAAAQANGTNYVELYFPPGIYLIAGGLTQGGATKGNAQIAIPIVAPTVKKVVVVIRSGRGGDTLPLWTQTVGGFGGAIFYSTLTSTYSSTYGTPSILGGPTPEQGYGNSTDSTFLFNNVHVVLDGIVAMVPNTNPSVSGFDFRGCAEMTVGAAGAVVNQPPSVMGGVLPTNSWVTGLLPPNQGNNDICNVGSWSCEGWYSGIAISEHLVVTSTRDVYCNVGIRINSQGYAHGNTILYASVESCLQYVQYDTYTHCDILDLDIEHAHGTVFDGGNDINDSGNNGRGTIWFEVSGGGEGEGTEPVVNGALNVEVINKGRKPATFNTSDGLVAVPSSGTALKNPYFRNACIQMSVTGGLISAVAVNTGNVGARTTGLATTGTSGSLALTIAASSAITITYTGTVTWVWTLL